MEEPPRGEFPVLAMRVGDTDAAQLLASSWRADAQAAVSHEDPRGLLEP